MWHWSSDEINLMKRKIQERIPMERAVGKANAFPHVATAIPIEFYFYGSMVQQAGSETRLPGNARGFLPHLLPGQLMWI